MSNNVYEFLKLCLNKISVDNNIKISLKSFNTLKEFMFSLSLGEQYDLSFIYCSPDNDDAFKISNTIKEQLNNTSINLVYISDDIYMDRHLLKSNPLRIIPTNFNSEDILEVWNAFCVMSCHHSHYLRITFKNNSYFIPYNEIIYVNSQAHQLNIITASETYVCYNKLSDFNDIPGFLKIHKSFIINLNHIKEYNYKYVIMSNGDMLTISQANRSTVKHYLDNL